MCCTCGVAVVVVVAADVAMRVSLLLRVCFHLPVLSSWNAGWLAVMVVGVCGFSFCIVSGGVFPVHVFGGGSLVNREVGKSVRLTRGVKKCQKEHTACLVLGP